METKHPNEFGPLKAAAEERKDLEKASKGHNILTYFANSRTNPDSAATSQASTSSSSGASASNEGQGGWIQATLEEALEGTWDINDHRAKSMTYKILEMIAMDNQPFSMVTDIGFARLVNYVKPKYQIPSRSYFAESVLPKVYENVKDIIKKAVSSAVAIFFHFR